MDYKAVYQQWILEPFFDEATREELRGLSDEKEIEERFYRDLEFGTGGLRGIMGAGTNRLNRYTVGKVSQGLAQYLLSAYGAEACAQRGVVIGYDTRNNSRDFSEAAAKVLSGMGVRVQLHAEARPTPQLSFSVRHLNALAGVVITASHNPKEYNGYKVYDEYGCQLSPAQAEKVIACVDAVTDYHTIDFEGNTALIGKVDVTEAFVAAVLKQSRNRDRAAKESLRVVYTPLHGTGSIPVRECLRQDGFTQVDCVAEQLLPDGDFPTVFSPNPEDPRALELGIAQAQRMGADIVLGTDPDSDRVGVAVRTKSGYELITGNQLGALLMDYVLAHTELSQWKKPAVVKTVVTSELGAEIARKYGLTVFSTLTGFKYIGEKITQFEQAEADSRRDYSFVFGYEESCGYLAGTHARDKDAVVASLLICEMAAQHKANGGTLMDRLEELYAEFGYYRDALDSYTLQGKDGLAQIQAMMVKLRSGASPFAGTAQVIDYKQPVAEAPGFGMLPASDVMKYILTDGSWIAVRPSGTEPKIKIYYSIRSGDRTLAEQQLTRVRSEILSALNLQ